MDTVPTATVVSRQYLNELSVTASWGYIPKHRNPNTCFTIDRFHDPHHNAMNELHSDKDNVLELWHAASAKKEPTWIEEHCWSYLTNEEKDRANSFKVATTRNQFVVGKGIARWSLSGNQDHLHEIEFGIEDQGKPFVRSPASAIKPFNLSHTDGLVVCLVGSTTKHDRIGVDVERLDRRTSTDLAERYFSAPEIEYLDRTTDVAAKKNLFLKIWTLKEAFIKAIGTGLRTPLSHFAFNNLDSSNPSINFLDPVLGKRMNQESMNWQFHSFEPRSGFIAATAVASSNADWLMPPVLRSFESHIEKR